MHRENPNPFQFNTQLDRTFLQDLFDGDLVYASEVFNDFIQTLPEYWNEVQTAYDSNDLNALKAAVHKCKTLFGYVGYTSVLELAKDFELSCSAVTRVPELESQYRNLLQKKDEAAALIRLEHKRILAYQEKS